MTVGYYAALSLIPRVLNVGDKTFFACNGDILYALNMTCNAVCSSCKVILFDEQGVTHSCKKNRGVQHFSVFYSGHGGHGDCGRWNLCVSTQHQRQTQIN